MTGPTVRVPGSFASSSLPPPDLSGAPQIALRDWRSWSDGSSTLAAGCFEARSASWSPEVTELAEQKLVDVSVGTVLRVRTDAGLHVASRRTDANVREQRLEGDGLRGRTFLAFRDGEVHACVAVCVGASGGSGEPACADAVATSRLEGTFEPPPEPGAALGALLYAVHHPRPAALAFVSLIVAAGIVSVWRRPRRGRARRF